MTGLKLAGHGVALVTPFADDHVDFPALERMIQLGIAGRTDFFVVLGPGSESQSLAPAESQRVIDFALDVVRGRRPVILGVSASSTKPTLTQLLADFPEGTPRLNAKRGLAGLLVEVPNDPGIPQPGLVAHFEAVAEASPLPIVLHQRRGPKGSGLQAASIIRLSVHPNIAGFVDGRCDFALTGEVIRSKSPSFAVVCGDDVSALPLLALGADAAISGIGNALPRAFSDLVGQAQFGELHAARSTHHQLAPLLRILETTASAPGLKAVMHQLGICSPDVRLPHARLAPTEAQAIYRAIAEMDRSVSGQ